MTSSDPGFRDNDLLTLWERIDSFCLDRGWNAELFVREHPENFGRVGARVLQFDGYHHQAFGNTSNEAIQGLAKSLEREGFDG